MYTIFVITTLLVVFTSIIMPVVKDVFNTTPTPPIASSKENKVLLYILLSCITIIGAPLMFLVWLSPNATKSFKEHLTADLKKS